MQQSAQISYRIIFIETSVSSFCPFKSCITLFNILHRNQGKLIFLIICMLLLHLARLQCTNPVAVQALIIDKVIKQASFQSGQILIVQLKVVDDCLQYSQKPVEVHFLGDLYALIGLSQATMYKSCSHKSTDIRQGIEQETSLQFQIVIVL